MRFRLSLSAFLLTFAGMAAAQNPDAPPDPTVSETITSQSPTFAPPAYAASTSPFGGSLLERSKLFGNWFGVRDSLLANGVTLDASSTQFYQGVAANGLRQDFAYAGREDYYLNVDGEKAGLWEGFFLTMHGETRYGTTVNGNTGSLMPVNVGSLFPAPNGTVSGLTALKLSQFVTEDFMVFSGKINMLDEWKQPYAAGRGVDAFMNTNLAFPVALARTVPYSTLGAGFAVLQNLEPVFVFAVLDTNNTPTTSGFQSFFNNGATMLTRVDIPVTIFDLPGHQGFGGTYSTGRYNDLTPTPYFNPQYGPGVSFGTVAGSWSVYYAADNALYVDPNNPKRTWGIFKNFGLADNGPSPVRWSVAFGVGGTSPLVSRPLDTFGIGYSWVDYTTPVKNLAPNLIPLQPDQALECYYNVAVTPWCRITPDVQVLLPARERSLPPASAPTDTALVLGMRAKIDF